jgi:hypothetical protein
VSTSESESESVSVSVSAPPSEKGDGCCPEHDMVSRAPAMHVHKVLVIVILLGLPVAPILQEFDAVLG